MSAWAKSPCTRLPTWTGFAMRFCPPYGAAREAASFHDDLHLLASLQPVAGLEPVEHAEALGLAVDQRHATRKPLHRVAGLDRDDLDPQGFCLLRLGLG